jgi:hypothetical protein
MMSDEPVCYFIYYYGTDPMGQRLSPGLPLSFVMLWSDLDQLLAECLVILYILLPETSSKRVMIFCSAGAGVLLVGQFDGKKLLHTRKDGRGMYI